jgi:hypothetical protein
VLDDVVGDVAAVVVKLADVIVDKHDRLKTNCVKPIAGVIVFEGNRSVSMLCTEQTPGEKSTATQDDVSKHSARHSGTDVVGYKIPFFDLVSSFWVQMLQT